MTNDNPKYEEWLTTVANTRLIFNTIEELEDLLDNHSIHSNGIRRCYSSTQKLRAAYRDLKIQVEQISHGLINLDLLLKDYSNAWNFFRQNLYRRANPEKFTIEMLSFCFNPNNASAKGKKAEIFMQIIKQNISIPFLILFLLKALPGYDSKDGDATDMTQTFDRVLKVLENFFANIFSFSLLPVITKARDEKSKTRLTLLLHIAEILDVYASYSDAQGTYDVANTIKENIIDLDIDGFWNESDGKPSSTDFWQITPFEVKGNYDLTHWHKNADNQIIGITYTLFTFKANDGNFVFYIVHPTFIKRRMKGQPYTDAEHVWYVTEPLNNHPDRLPLTRLISSSAWQPKISLTRCSDSKLIKTYEDWLNSCSIVKQFKELEYTFQFSIHAITREHIYVKSASEGIFYKIPIDAHDGFENIKINDRVGIMTMGGKNYIVFDEFLLFIPTTDRELRKFGITKVQNIE
ncbi:MAG: hypothetical protein ACI30S_07575 [Muribaculaceae bacterium]